MDISELSLRGPGVNYYEMPSIHQKRTLAFINNFISSTVSMMNKLARSCEIKLQKFECQLQRMDACLKILEAKLDSIPGLDDVGVQQVVTSPVPTESQAQQEQAPESAPSEKTQDPHYAKYTRMVQVGVPVQAVKLKMIQDGLDPNELDNSAHAPPPPPMQADSESESRSSSVSD